MTEENKTHPPLEHGEKILVSVLALAIIGFWVWRTYEAYIARSNPDSPVFERFMLSVGGGFLETLFISMMAGLFFAIVLGIASLWSTTSKRRAG